jgi:hypothetical protein
VRVELGDFIPVGWSGERMVSVLLFLPSQVAVRNGLGFLPITLSHLHRHAMLTLDIIRHFNGEESFVDFSENTTKGNGESKL